MKIAFIASRYHINQHHWMTALQETGHEVRFYCSYSEPNQEHYETLQPIVVPQRTRPAWQRWLLGAAQRLRGHRPREQFHFKIDRTWLRTELSSYTPDIIIVRDLFFPLSLAGFAVAKQLDIPAIHYNQYPLELTEPLPTRMAKLFGLAPNCRISPSRTSELGHNLENNCWYVPLITTTVYDAANRTYQTDDITRLLFVGKYKSERKNHLLLLDAIAQLVPVMPIHLTMVGSDVTSNPEYFSRIKNRIDTLQLQQHVTVLVDVPHIDMPQLYQTHDIFVLPSYSEPYAISPIEAMGYGLPVIVTRSNGGRQAVVPTVTGMVIPDNNTTALVQAITEIGASRETIRTMGAAAVDRKNALYSSDAFTQRFEAVTTAVVKNKH